MAGNQIGFLRMNNYKLWFHLAVSPTHAFKLLIISNECEESAIIGYNFIWRGGVASHMRTLKAGVLRHLNERRV